MPAFSLRYVKLSASWNTVNRNAHMTIELQCLFYKVPKSLSYQGRRKIDAVWKRNVEDTGIHMG